MRFNPIVANGRNLLIYGKYGALGAHWLSLFVGLNKSQGICQLGPRGDNLL